MLRTALKSLLEEHDLEPITSKQYSRSLDRFELFLGRPAEVTDLSLEAVNGFLAWLKESGGLGGVSVRNYRKGICRLWNYCVEPLGIAPEFKSSRIRMPKVVPKAVSAWTLSQVDQLIKSCDGLAGKLRSGVPAMVFMRAWIWVGYETAFRPGDMRAMLWPEVDFEGRSITVAQNKTGYLHTAYFGEVSSECLKELQEYGQERVFPLNKYGVRRWESFLYDRATELYGFSRLPRQGIGKLRHTHATEVYKSHGLAACAESLGHRGSVKTAQDHYIDSRVLRKGTLPPPPGTGHGRADTDRDRKRA